MSELVRRVFVEKRTGFNVEAVQLLNDIRENLAVNGLVNMRVLAEYQGELHPTLAGLLALGKYPQKYFPSLAVTFTLGGAESI